MVHLTEHKKQTLDLADNDASSWNGGFSLVEVTVALTVFFIVLLGVGSSFFYAVVSNLGNNTRTQALMIMQRETEVLRNARFSPLVTDSALAGGEHPAAIITTPSGGVFRVVKTVDDDTTTDGIQTMSGTTLKEITLVVSLERPTPGWQTAVPVSTIFFRARAN